MNVIYVELGPWGAMKRAIAALRNGETDEGERISAAVTILEQASREALLDADSGGPVDVVAVLPTHHPAEERDALTQAVASGDLVELSVRGRVVGVLRQREVGRAS